MLKMDGMGIRKGKHIDLSETGYFSLPKKVVKSLFAYFLILELGRCNLTGDKD